MPNATQYWFPAKTYGWGWGLPATWQGWLVLAVYLAGVVAISLLLSPAKQPGLFSGAVLTLSLLLVLVCWKTGEPPRWRWGSK
jgi:hypothetical protein